MYLSGVGVARARMELARGMKQSVLHGGDSPQELMHLILVTQYLDTLMAVKPDEVIVRINPSEVFDMYESLPKG